MSGGITVKEFKYIPGVNDAEYIKKLEELRKIDKEIINTAVAKIKKLSAQLKEQSEIIRCKDCKRFRKPSSIVNADWGWCSGWPTPLTTFVKVDGFCHRAERRDEADDH